MSAVCAYSLEDIDRVFDEGTFAVRTDERHRWAHVPAAAVPQPRPGQCATSRSAKENEHQMQFLRRHPLMYDSVWSVQQRPIAVDNSMRFLNKFDNFSNAQISVPHTPASPCSHQLKTSHRLLTTSFSSVHQPADSSNSPPRRIWFTQSAKSSLNNPSPKSPSLPRARV
jgi:hypothetical protein